MKEIKLEQLFNLLFSSLGYEVYEVMKFLENEIKLHIVLERNGDFIGINFNKDIHDIRANDVFYKVKEDYEFFK
ncbi:hypothetical protein [Mammaliicoccus vitulinus]|uniref:hypothetical protein n=1 Tax=Mammaliicoccus vitulinus TaxID=71237 RepID=UPI00248BF5C5|nr:hypothetical protein [Mammaliicoccus vitulinus]